MIRPPRGPTLYNPRELAKDELLGSFVAREAVLERLVEEVRRDAGRSIANHCLVVGARGMGKSTLLHRLRYAIDDDPALAREWLPVTFREEQFNVDRSSKLYRNVIDALCERLEEDGLHDRARAIDARVDALPSVEEHRAEAARKLVIDAARELDRRLVLLIDNLALIVDRLSEKEAWGLRSFLQDEDRLLVVAASPYAFEGYGKPFYDFFRVFELAPLTLEEMRAMIDRLAHTYGHERIVSLLDREPSRLKTLHVLAGGNPRVAVLMYQVLAVRSEGALEDHLQRALDLVTPLYKARVDELPPQLQGLVDALAIHWDPLSAGELAEHARMDVNTVSSQLARLVTMGVVEKVRYDPPTKTGFQIAERFFNVWYVMRCASRRVRRRLEWLVDLLNWFYGDEGVEALARRHLSRAFEAPAAADVACADAGASAWIALGLTVGREGRHDEAEKAFRRAVALDGENAGAWDGLGVALSNLGRSAESLAAFERAATLLPNDPEVAVRLGMKLREAGRHADAERECRRAVELQPGDADAWRAHTALAVTLAELGRHRDSDEAFERTIALDPTAATPHNHYAWMRYLRGEVDERTESLARRALELEPANPHLQHTAATILARRGRWREAAALAERFLPSDDAGLRGQEHDILLFFREAVAAGKVREARELLADSSLGTRWRPLAVALAAVEAGHTLGLRRVAPEVRQPALDMIRLLQPGVELPELPAKEEPRGAAERAQRPRRRGRP